MAVSSPGLVALIANGASGVLHGNPQVFQYSPSWKRHANSAFSFVEAELGEDGRVDIPARSFDLLGECYLEVGVREDRSSSLSDRLLRASDVVAACSFSVDGRTGSPVRRSTSRWPTQPNTTDPTPDTN